MAYCRMGEVSGGMIDGVSTPGLGLDLTQWMEWNPGSLTTIGGTPGFYDRPPAAGGAVVSSVPELLARPAETGESPPWLLLAGLGLVAYMVMK